MSKINKIILVAGVFLFFGLAAFSSQALTDPLKGATIPSLISRVTGFAVGIAVSLATLMAIVAAILLITAEGNEGRVKKGKDALTYAVIGLAIVLGANSILGIVSAQLGAETAEGLLSNIIKYLQLIGIPLAVVMFIWGSILYSTGSAKNVSAAYKIFLWTSVGVAILLVAFSIDKFVFYFLDV